MLRPRLCYVVDGLNNDAIPTCGRAFGTYTKPPYNFYPKVGQMADTIVQLINSLNMFPRALPSEMLSPVTSWTTGRGYREVCIPTSTAGR